MTATETYLVDDDLLGRVCRSLDAGGAGPTLVVRVGAGPASATSTQEEGGRHAAQGSTPFRARPPGEMVPPERSRHSRHSRQLGNVVVLRPDGDLPATTWAGPGRDVVVVVTSTNAAQAQAALAAAGLSGLGAGHQRGTAEGPHAAWAERQLVPVRTPTAEGVPGPDAPPAQALTAREVEVLHAFANGALAGQVARQLFVSPKTVKNHLAHIYAKLGVNCRTQAVARALKLGLVTVG